MRLLMIGDRGVRHRGAGLAALLVLPSTSASQRLSDDALLARGLTAFDRLPSEVTSADAVPFADAVRYLFAYEQRSPPRLQHEPAFAGQIGNGLLWLSRNLEHVQAAGARGDDLPVGRFRSNSELRELGFAAYRELPRGNASISPAHVVPFIRALANLYALDQRGGEDREVREAVRRLEQNVRRIAAAGSGGRADDFARPAPWAPTGMKPPIMRNEIRSFQAVRVSSTELAIRFDYSYLGDFGEQVRLNAIALGRGRRGLGFGGCCAVLTSGSGSAVITIRKPADNDERLSTAVMLCMIRPQGGTFYCQDFQSRQRW